ncbi:type VI secretion system baseplate subunit TssE [Salmonella enterica]|uniref:type VI secretion system baseplate subunit TssE n=1 Tax=Salmonella enterica TaxID=28901 RepID=UPI0009B0B21C|nr:type VI secretion system baseplate subunit TssE [Salmonella enterica]EAR7275546.1 type VI secretion system baseplate subunit TssE [Salmonella enterica]EBH7239814.1 type VI secretion system baseplate subunit TssE [Salmonella enterica]EBI4006381.1 type VI secretion system baseplate subunit TssE [Salmonella enterica]EBK0851715.1 type VI secretion system baseplate subunit TssE [Salmonella enterica]EBL3229105.1 type VI secretion system baseplate subunit TssE [Salmonella enterica]
MIPAREKPAGSLFERLENPPARNWREGSNIEAFRQSIRHSLRNILNTRSGSCRGTPGLGIEEPEGSDNYRSAMSQAIVQCIERYEPRISHAEVRAILPQAASPQEIIFRITAWVTFNDIDDVLEFDMAPDSSQHYRVE